MKAEDKTLKNNPMNDEVIDYFFNKSMLNIGVLAELLNPDNNEIDLTKTVNIIKELDEDVNILDDEIEELKNKVYNDNAMYTSFNLGYICFLQGLYHDLLKKFNSLLEIFNYYFKIGVVKDGI